MSNIKVSSGICSVSVVSLQDGDYDRRPTERTDDSSEASAENVMIYNVHDRPPFYLSIFFGLQVCV